MNDTPLTRKLAAIFSADVVGYSALMAADEEGTLSRLAQCRKIMDALIAQHGGRIVNTAGDSVLAEFAAAIEAVRAALEIQEALKAGNAAQPPIRQMRFRIGINLGDVIVMGDNLMGDGINVAARLQSLAAPGGICIAGSVYDQIQSKLSIPFAYGGQQSLKNIPHPVHVFQLPGETSEGPPLSSPAPSHVQLSGAKASRPGKLLAIVFASVFLIGFAALGVLFIGPVKDRIVALFLDSPDPAEMAWQIARQSEQISDLENFLHDHGASRFAPEARGKLADLQRQQAVLAQAAATQKSLDLARQEAERIRAETEQERRKLAVERDRLAGETARQKAKADEDKARIEAEAKQQEKRKKEEEVRLSTAATSSTPSTSTSQTVVVANPSPPPTNSSTQSTVAAVPPPPIATPKPDRNGLWRLVIECGYGPQGPFTITMLAAVKDGKFNATNGKDWELIKCDGEIGQDGKYSCHATRTVNGSLVNYRAWGSKVSDDRSEGDASVGGNQNSLSCKSNMTRMR